MIAFDKNSCTLTPPPCMAEPAACPKVFRISVSKDGYYPLSQSGLQLGSPDVSVQLSSKLTLDASTQQLRVVLSWGNQHGDLDSYMIVPPVTAGDNSCTVNY